MTEAARRTATRAAPARPRSAPALRPAQPLASTQRAADETTLTLSLSGDQLGAIVALVAERVEALVRQLVAAELRDVADPRRSGPDGWLTVEQVSTQLQVSRRSVYRALRDGRLAAVKVGAGWRVPRDALTAWASPAVADVRHAQLPTTSPPVRRSSPTSAYADASSFGARVRERVRRTEGQPGSFGPYQPPTSNGGT